MDKYRVFAFGKEHVFSCDSSIDYEHFKDFLLDLLDVSPQVTVINDSYEYPEIVTDNLELFYD